MTPNVNQLQWFASVAKTKILCIICNYITRQKSATEYALPRYLKVHVNIRLQQNLLGLQHQVLGTAPMHRILRLPQVAEHYPVAVVPAKESARLPPNFPPQAPEVNVFISFKKVPKGTTSDKIL